MLGAAALAVSVAIPAAGATTGAPAAPGAGASDRTSTPIKHVIVIIGENHTFDNVFATYRPPKGQHVRNLLSERIVTRTGGLGPKWAKAAQLTASDTKKYTVTPAITGAYAHLPQPNTTYVSSGCSGQPGNTPDKRFPANLPDAPFQITKYVPYFDSHLEYTGGCEFFGAYVGDPIHRFYQMWQQSVGHHYRLATWVANTAGDDNGAIPPAPIYQGGLSMSYYNMAEGDAPILNDLAQHYAISDNYHQAVQGGTGANHIALGTGFAASYQNAAGQPTPPPPGEIENPNPKPGTNNNYTQDGYGSSTTPNTGGSYSECADHSQPGVGAIFRYLARLPYKVMDNCQPGRYYLLNNYNPGYTVTGALEKAPYTVPPQKTDYVTIGQALSERHISWGYYGEGYNNGNPQSQYCGICDPMQYSSAIMTNPALRKNTQHDLSDFISQAVNGTLPAVTFLKPGDDDGHPGYSTLAAFENFTARAIAAVQDNPAEWRSTAIFVTFDEGGGYYDSGYIQPVSFFGDGPRVPMIVVSPYAKRGAVDHTYTDHVSILKFIEANWGLSPLTSYSEDNLPNPAPGVYVPRNRPAVGDLMTLFDFRGPDFATLRLPAAAQPRSTGHAPAISNAQR
ncbi:MAG: alkaline phosphatase family protein [Streptosporangiaceae bacterium]|nr:alkaline phosphatase family protein [Streptosporangiaceae bacterium]